MWFNNALIYDISSKENNIDFQTALNEQRLKACPPHTRFTYGFIPPFKDGELSHEISGASLICLAKDERILPKSVIKQTAAERIRQKELEENRSLKKSECSKILEDVEFELLPKAFCAQKKWQALIDTKNQQLIINTASLTQADQVTAYLKKALPELNIEPLFSEQNLCHIFKTFVQSPDQLPQGFALASDCQLISPDDEKKKINCKGYELPADEVLTLLDKGLHPTELTLIWQDRIQFTLTHQLVIKRLKCLDYLVDSFAEIQKLDDDFEQQDAALFLLMGELHSLISAIKKISNHSPQ